MKRAVLIELLIGPFVLLALFGMVLWDLVRGKSLQPPQDGDQNQ